MTEERVPAEVFCLASFLAEEMEARGWTSVDVGVRMSADDDSEGKIIENILVMDLLLAVQDERVLLSPRLFGQLERAFGVSDGFFKRLAEPWEKYPDRRVPFEAPDHLFSQ